MFVTFDCHSIRIRIRVQQPPFNGMRKCVGIRIEIISQGTHAESVFLFFVFKLRITNHALRILSSNVEMITSKNDKVPIRYRCVFTIVCISFYRMLFFVPGFLFIIWRMI